MVALRPSHAVAASALLVFSGTVGFAALRPDYHHVAQTISELGADGSPYFRLAGLGMFLPSGALVWWALWRAHRLDARRDSTRAFIALAGLGAGYVGAALFPCDPGSPVWGSTQQQIHNLAGVGEYFGCGAGFFLLGRQALRDTRSARAALWSGAGVLAWTGLVLLGTESLFAFRGAIQRVTEATLFFGTYCAVRSRQSLS